MPDTTTTNGASVLGRLPTLLAPRSVALVGASDRTQWTRMVMDSLAGHGFTGRIHPVNRRGGTVYGHAAATSCQEIGEQVDVAALMLPGAAVHDALRDVAAAGIENVIVLASGLGEGGGTEAARLQQELIDVVTELELLMLGPNSLGFMNLIDATGAWFAPPPPVIVRGAVALISQSGAIGHAVTSFAASQQVGLSHVIATGNEALVDTIDIAAAVLQDERVRVAAIFAEEIRQPEKLRAVAAEALEAGKAIVMLKAGSSALSAELAISHTGALVGDDGIIDAGLRSLGVVRVQSIEELVITSGLIAHTGPLREGGLGVISISGGACDLVADRAEDLGIPLPELASGVHNPFDVTGLVLSEPGLVTEYVDTFAGDDAVSLLAYFQVLPDENFQPPGQAYWEALGPALSGLGPRGILVDQTMQTILPDTAQQLAGLGVPYVLGGLENAMVAIGRDLWWSEQVRRLRDAAATPEATPAAIAATPDMAATWSEAQALTLIAEHGVPVVPWQLVADADAAVAAAAELGYPVVVKVASAAIAHKSDLGGVALDLQDAEQVRAAYTRVMDVAAAAGAPADGAIVAAMRDSGTELIVGVVRDPQWGHVLTLGLGGIWVNVLDDKSVRVLPVDRPTVHDMIGELRGAALLSGARGTAPVDLERLADVVLAISDLALAGGDRLAALEINPLKAEGDRIEALDALCTWRDA
jgi:acetate---CoA ligase (ADP-forming)